MRTNAQTFTVRHDQPIGELGRIAHRDAIYCAVHNGHEVWTLTGHSEWTLIRSARVAATFTPES